MTTMDVKTISWVGDMYQKFEAMCVEVEETMYQDSVKYVENQVKTVGACVKRFYSDVMQDLIPLTSDDSVKLDNTGQKLVHYADDGIYNKPVVDVKGEQVKSESGHLRRDSYLASGLDETVDNRLPSEVKFCPSEISNPETVGSQLALLSKDGESTAGLGKMLDEVDETVECLATSFTSSSSNPAISEEFGNDEDSSKMPDAGSDEPVADEFEMDDIDKEALKVTEQLGKLKLDESCVLVDKYEHFSVSHPEGKQRSYKKKIRDVLYLRRWSSSKNPEKLSVWQEDIDSTSSSLESGKPNLQSCSLESGWEIL